MQEAREASIKGIGGCENIYNDLFKFFKKKKRADAAPTREEVMRDVNALLSGKKDGEVIIRNLKPKVSGGKHEVIEEKFTTNKHE
jgi:hypothetical protein